MSDLVLMLRLAQVRARSLVLAIFVGALTLLAALTLTVLSGWLITRAWQMPPILDLGIAITAVRGLGISRAVFRYLDRLVGHRVALDATTRLRAALFDAIASDNTGAAHSLSRGAGLARLGSDADRVADFIVRSLIPAGIALVVSLISVGAAIALHFWTGVILLVGFTITGGLVPYLAAMSYRRCQAALSTDELGIALDDQLLHRVEFAVAGLSRHQIDRTVAASRRNSAEIVAAERPLAIAAGLTELGMGLSTVLIVAVGLASYQGSATWLGMLVLLPLAAFESHGPLGSAATHAVDAKDAAARLRKLIGSPAQTRSKQPTSYDIDATDLALAHGTGTWTLVAPFGSRHRITGPSGIGKTTFLLTLAGLIPAAGGRLEIAGVPMSEINQDWLRTHIHAHPEDEWIFATTIRDNLLVAAPSATDAIMAEALSAVGLTDFSLGDVLAAGADSLSSGQRRRLLLARALCSTAPVLLLDEPTEHIASEDASRLLKMLLEEPLPGALRERTVVVVTHAH
ncbi:thiol reductant ABC exporter subunit CydC [Corynebacterium sp. H128]|uniref:thiol reductant ABC exporter subunit CydC n=1 Tax=Corynebacterium sp. H128 TaxID=3133427 RepID=UPI0030B57592